MKQVTFFTFILLFNPSFIKADGPMAEGPGREWRDFRVYFIQGCRQNGMAGAGYSLPNDENLLLLNPAGLGIKNKRFENFAISYGNSFEPQTNWYKDIPVFQDHYLSFCFQRPKNYVGGFSALADIYPLIMQGEIAGSEWDPVSQTIIPIGDTLSDKRIYISSIFGYGRDLSFINLKNHSVGISAIVMGYHATNFGEPITDGSIELTIGYAAKFFKDFHFGFVFSNIPIVKSFYSDREKATLLKIIPSFGFNRVLKRENKIDAIKLFAEVNYKLTIEEVSSGDFVGQITDTSGNTINNASREFYKRHFFVGGYELGINESVFIRNGYRWAFFNDFDLDRFEIATGLGFNNRKNFELNFYFASSVYRDISSVPPFHFGSSINFFSLSRKSRR